MQEFYSARVLRAQAQARKQVMSRTCVVRYSALSFNPVVLISLLYMRRRALGRDCVVLGQYLSVTSQLMVESRNDRADNAWGCPRPTPRQNARRMSTKFNIRSAFHFQSSI